MADEIEDALLGQIPGPPMAEYWNRTSWYCRYRGRRPLDVRQGEGDYYAGPHYWCRSCGMQFTMG